MTRMKREIYWVEQWRFWENNPLFYKDIILEGMFNLVSRDFAPLKRRLKSLIARQKDVPGVLQAARENLSRPPVIYTQQAIDQVKGSRSFFQNLPNAFKEIKDPAEYNSYVGAIQTTDPRQRTRLLPACVEILLAGGEVEIGREKISRRPFGEMAGVDEQRLTIAAVGEDGS